MTISKNARLVLITVFCVLAAKAVANYDKLLPHSWQTYTAPDASFSVDLPDKFTVETIHTPDERGNPIAVQLISAQPTKSTSYLCSYFDRENDPEESPQQVMEAARDGSLKKIQGVMTSQKQLEFQGYPALDVQGHARADSLVDYRFILVKDRLYMLMAVATAKGDREPRTIQRLFNSFRTPQKP
jgi:hypothetical protein